MSGFVRPEKDSKQREWEVGCVTYQPDGNILNLRWQKDLWKVTFARKYKNRLNVVTLQKAKMGSLMRAASSEREYR
jgi:hypothetical protein